MKSSVCRSSVINVVEPVEIYLKHQYSGQLLLVAVVMIGQTASIPLNEWDFAGLVIQLLYLGRTPKNDDDDGALFVLHALATFAGIIMVWQGTLPGSDKRKKPLINIEDVLEFIPQYRCLESLEAVIRNDLGTTSAFPTDDAEFDAMPQLE